MAPSVSIFASTISFPEGRLSKRQSAVQPSGRLQAAASVWTAFSLWPGHDVFACPAICERVGRLVPTSSGDDAGGDAAGASSCHEGRLLARYALRPFFFRGRGAANRSADRSTGPSGARPGTPGVAPRPPLRSRRAEGHRGLLPLVLARRASATGLCLVRLTSQGDGLDSLRLPVAARRPLCLLVAMD